LRTHLTTFSQAKDPMEAEDWLKSIEKKLEIAQRNDHEKVLFVAHQLFGIAADWWKTYRNSHQNVGAITYNKFKARFRTHYVPRGTLKLKKKEFSDLQQGSLTMNEYLNKFTQLSRYAPDDVNTDA
jgi:predicted alpha/beta hydrolase family esterase